MAELYNYVAETGVIIPDTSELQAAVESEYKQVFGADLITTADTPQGVLIVAETLARDSVVRNNANLANQINPNIAGGVFLDAIMALTGSARTPATKSTVAGVLCYGASGTIIPQGSQAKTAAGDIFESVAAATIGDGGSVSVAFQSVEYGPIPASAGALNIVASAVLGWETVSNPNSAVLGAQTQSDVAARSYRKNTLALQAKTVSEAVTSALYAVPGVTSLSFRENVTAGTQVIDSVVLGPHSIYACVKGGLDADIAAALLSSKSVGAGWNGNISVNTIDSYSGQSYLVKFDRPTEQPIKVRATVKSSAAIGNPIQSVKDAIMAYANGQIDGETGFGVGANVSPFELAGAVNCVYPSLYVQNMEIAFDDGSAFSNLPITIPINGIATLVESAITVNTV